MTTTSGVAAGRSQGGATMMRPTRMVRGRPASAAPSPRLRCPPPRRRCGDSRRSIGLRGRRVARTASRNARSTLTAWLHRPPGWRPVRRRPAARRGDRDRRWSSSQGRRESAPPKDHCRRSPEDVLDALEERLVAPSASRFGLVGRQRASELLEQGLLFLGELLRAPRRGRSRAGRRGRGPRRSACPCRAA